MIDPATIESWLGELDLVPLERADREGVASWDLLLDGRRRRRVRFTIIHDPAVALVVWVQFAPPINDAFRKSYRKLLRWNDEFPFVKFAVSDDERPILTAELGPDRIDREDLGLTIARLLALCDRLVEDAAEWLATEAKPSPGATPARSGVPLLERYAESVREIVGDALAVDDEDSGVDIDSRPERAVPTVPAAQRGVLEASAVPEESTMAEAPTGAEEVSSRR